MKKIYSILLALMMAGCSQFDDSAILDKIAELEKEQEQLQQQVDTQQALLDALANNLTITSITPTEDGYIITFSDDNAISINNGNNNSNEIFESVTIDNYSVTFVLVDGNVIVIPLGGNNGDGGDDGKEDTQGVSIVGTWQAFVKIEEGYDYTTKLTFNQNNTGVISFTHPQWEGENGAYHYVTDTDDFTYSYDYNLGVLSLFSFPNFGGETIEVNQIEASAAIVSNNGVDVLHINNALLPYWMSVFRRVQ